MRLRALVRKEILLLVRDPHALAVLFIMPTLFLVIMAGAMSSYLQDRLPPLQLVLEVPQNSESSRFFHDALQAQLPDSRLLEEGPAQMARIGLPADFDQRLLDTPHQGPTLSFPAQFDRLSRQRLHLSLIHI